MQKFVLNALLTGFLLAGLLAGPGAAFSQGCLCTPIPFSAHALTGTSPQTPVPGTGSFSGKIAFGSGNSLQLPAKPGCLPAYFDYPCGGSLLFPGKWDAPKCRPFNPYIETYPYPIKDSVGILSPDKMRCRVADLSRVEKMPVLRLQNQRPRDPMPNSLSQVPGDAAISHERRFVPKE